MALVLLDLNGTLLDPGRSQEAVTAAVRRAMIHTLAGAFRPLADLLSAVGGTLPEAMPPYPDVPPGLERLGAAGHRLAVLTNSARETAEAQLAKAGIRDAFEQVIGADQIGAHKPDPRTYAFALDRLGAVPDDAWLVAAHDWDVIGARVAGLRAAFVDRGGPRPVTVDVQATVARLDELALS